LGMFGVPMASRQIQINQCEPGFSLISVDLCDLGQFDLKESRPGVSKNGSDWVCIFCDTKLPDSRKKCLVDFFP
jgi:hypothetical protein